MDVQSGIRYYILVAQDKDRSLQSSSLRGRVIVNSVPPAPFPARDGERPGRALLDRDYFDGPGEELWSASAADREPDPWWDGPGEDWRDGRPWSAPDGANGGDRAQGGVGGAFAAGGPPRRGVPGGALCPLGGAAG